MPCLPTLIGTYVYILHIILTWNSIIHTSDADCTPQLGSTLHISGRVVVFMVLIVTLAIPLWDVATGVLSYVLLILYIYV